MLRFLVASILIKVVRGGVVHTDYLYSFRIAWVLLCHNHGDLRGAHAKSD